MPTPQFLPHPIIKINMFRKMNEATEVIIEVITTETNKDMVTVVIMVEIEVMEALMEEIMVTMVDEEEGVDMGIINAINMEEVEIFENTEEADIKDMEVTIKEIKMTIRGEVVTDTEITLEEVMEDRIQIIATTEIDNLKHSLCIILHSYLISFVVI